MVTFSLYPYDPRPRRAIEALLQEGMIVDLICLADGSAPKRETSDGLNILRLPIAHRRRGAVSYAYNYSAIIFLSAGIFALRSLRRRYDLVHVHNMPDILVLSSLVPKLLGAKVLLDLHDPMPELMTTIFGLDKCSPAVRLMKWLEKWSIARSDVVVTVNEACRRIFTSRSCRPEKVSVVMNSPDERIFPFREVQPNSVPARSSRDRFVLMYHGTLVERNGLDLAVAALGQIRAAVPRAELRIYGIKTPFLEKVMADVHHNGLEDRVHYLGPRSLEDLPLEIECCDVGVVPNQRSAFADIATPTRIFEYLALGKPVIAPRVPGIQDYFSPESLVFFEPGNTEELARKIEYIASHYNEAVASAARGQRVYLVHTWAQEKRRLVDLVNALLHEERLDRTAGVKVALKSRRDRECLADSFSLHPDDLQSDSTLEDQVQSPS